MAKYLYEVTDALTGKILFQGLTRGELSKALDMPPKHIHLFAESQAAYRGQYYICVKGQQNSWGDDFQEEWNLITEELRQYRGLDRIKIVEENGGTGNTSLRVFGDTQGDNNYDECKRSN